MAEVAFAKIPARMQWHRQGRTCELEQAVQYGSLYQPGGKDISGDRRQLRYGD